MTPPSSPTSPKAPASPPSPIQRRWRSRTGVALLVLGVLLVVASAFLPWLRYSVIRGTDHAVTNTTYSVWGLPYSALFPTCVWFPLANIVWALSSRFLGAGGKPVGRVGLIVLCFLGTIGAFAVTALSELSIGLAGIYWGSRSGTTADNTLLLGWWLCLAGFVLLIASLLLLGREPASQGATRRAPPRGNSPATLFVPRGGLNAHRR